MKTILCVDDIETNLFTLEALFDTYHSNDYKILTAISGIDALGILLKESIDLILLDIMMPDMDGYETAKLILSNKKTKHIPIIFLTAKKDEDTITNCYKVGGVDYMSKPYNDIELFTRVEFHLDLARSKEILIQEKQFAQDILDLQDNMIIITNGAGIIRINKSTSDFFELNVNKEFGSGFSCISEMFIEEDGYFHMGIVDDEFWIDVLLKKLQEQECIVLLYNRENDQNESYSIKVKNFKNNYLISLTNVTSMVEETNIYKHDASYDGLTQIYNRIKLNKILNNEILNASTNSKKIAFVLLDIDHFKDVNDTYGHLVGDDVLVKLSNILRDNIRQTDIVARWGGEEFVLILSNIDIDKAVEIAETLRVKIELEHFEQVNHITCSFGVSAYEQGDDIESLTKRADEALYEAKNSGRNQVKKL